MIWMCWLANPRGNTYQIDLPGGGRPANQKWFASHRRQAASRWVDHHLSRSHICGRLSFRKKYLPPQGETPRETGRLRPPHSKCGAKNPLREKCLAIVRFSFNVLGSNFGWENRAYLYRPQVRLRNFATNANSSIRRSRLGSMASAKSTSRKCGSFPSDLLIRSSSAKEERQAVDHVETQSPPEAKELIRKHTAARSTTNTGMERPNLSRRRNLERRKRRSDKPRLLSLRFLRLIWFRLDLRSTRSGNYLIPNTWKPNIGSRYERLRSK